MNNIIGKIANDDIKFRNSADGLWDMSIGLAFIIAGVAFAIEAVTIASAFYFPIFILIVALKQKVVYPRIGYVKHKGMDMKTRKVMTMTFILGIVMLLAAFLMYLNVAKGQNSEFMRNIARNYDGIILGLVIAFVIVLLGKTFGISRFYWYSPLIFLAFLAIKYIEYERIISVSFLTCGGIMFLIGIAIFIKFVKTYPRLEEKADE